MKKLVGMVLALTLLSPIPAQSAKTVPYKNQKAGQFCKTVDIKKKVSLPNGTVLTCKKDGSRARWKN
jgi:hypothetical protein